MKKYTLTLIILIASAIVMTQTSCSDLLDQEPQGEWLPGEGKVGSFESDVFTLYAQIRSYNVSSGNVAMAIHSFRSEDADKGSTISDGQSYATMYDDFQYNPSDGAIRSYWTDNYRMIHTVNRLLDTLKVTEERGVELSETDLINRSEAHFFRAFAYFNLVRAFGEVPLIDFKITDAAEANIPKTTVNNIYALIDSDLTEAENLPLEWQRRYIGRLTYGAARALHAKAYMQRNDWSNMYTAATDVIGTGLYNLNTPFNVIFREEGENTSESVLELQCTASPGIGINTIGSQFAEVQGVRGSGEWNLGWGWNTPSDTLAAAFEPGDPRKDETLLYFARSVDEQNNMQPNTPYGERPLVTDPVVNNYYNKKAYTNPTKRITYGARSGGWVNIRLIRYSDVILMAAEAANELGKTSEALDYLEMVRARARGGNSSVLPKVTTTNQAELRKSIQHERRIELAMEYDRFYDLVRWGIAEQVLHAAGKTGYQSRHALLPLPQSEIDRSNGVLVQNPNY